MYIKRPCTECNRCMSDWCGRLICEASSVARRLGWWWVKSNSFVLILGVCWGNGSAIIIGFTSAMLLRSAMANVTERRSTDGCGEDGSTCIIIIYSWFFFFCERMDVYYSEKVMAIVHRISKVICLIYDLAVCP